MATAVGVESPTFLIINVTEDGIGAQTTNGDKLTAHTQSRSVPELA